MTVITKLKGFTDKMELFCQEYLVDLNATQAAIRAGYSMNTANVQGSQLLSKLSIKQRIGELAEKNAIAAGVTPALVLSTIKEAMDRCNQERIPVMQGGKQVTIVDEEGNEQPVFKFDSNGVYKGAELLGKYLKLFTDRTEISGANGKPFPVVSVDMSAEEITRIYTEYMQH